MAGRLVHREATKLIRARGEEHAPLSQTVKFFGGWTRSKEAPTLSGNVTPRRIRARFNERRIRKIWKYTEETLAHWMEKAVAEYGRPPQVAEYDWWRQRELALAKPKGDVTLHIPSPQPFRKRWRTWPEALLALGYDPEAIDSRLERGVNTTAGERDVVRRAPRGR
ncbi:hypothetical protein [Patulibacter sp.]|uniref:homing endonuclease associated repeat-containing protein n=1 Tax=Patulibacter sp. TaxID=1912859 RepID=UPI00271F7397|nr:hypothetical protein [Patulibacter sp.]MDO9410080.1 hypothetical protein [Patulibacter sp.]